MPVPLWLMMLRLELTRLSLSPQILKSEFFSVYVFAKSHMRPQSVSTIQVGVVLAYSSIFVYVSGLIVQQTTNKVASADNIAQR